MKHLITYSFICLGLLSCKEQSKMANESVIITEDKFSENSLISTEQQKDYKSLILESTDYITDGFDFPVGKPNAKGYYNAQKFQENNHLGDDWNGVGGGNSDLGDPIYAIGNGYITEVKDYKGGWGNVLRIVHLYNDTLYESLYAHCDSIIINSNRFIKKGEQIATIGNCDGTYFAHLHLEIRNEIDKDIGGGYSIDTTGYLDPTDFINKNRN